MAWVAVEQFNYTPGDNWNGASGGSGWGTNWAITDTGAEYIISAENVFGTGSGLTQNSGGGGTGNAARNLSASVASGTVYFFLRCNEQQVSNGIRVLLSDGITSYMVGLVGSDLILYSTSGNVALVSGYTVDTWYEVQLEFDTTVPQNRARVRTYGGTWGAWTSLVPPGEGGGTGEVTTVNVQHLGTDATVDGFCGGINPTQFPVSTFVPKQRVIQIIN